MKVDQLIRGETYKKDYSQKDREVRVTRGGNSKVEKKKERIKRIEKAACEKRVERE